MTSRKSSFLHKQIFLQWSLPVLKLVTGPFFKGPKSSWLPQFVKRPPHFSGPRWVFAKRSIQLPVQNCINFLIDLQFS